MAKPALAVMAAGMGSRYGGLKQIDPMTEEGEIIIDFSLHDAMRAGFEDIVFIVKKEIEADIRAHLDRGAAKRLNIRYAFQELDDLPAGFSVPTGRVKPWGTCHAVFAARDCLRGNFAVINADDYYGPDAFRRVFDELSTMEDAGRRPTRPSIVGISETAARPEGQHVFSMVGYRLINTLTENGHVARGVCRIDDAGNLVGVKEHAKIWLACGAPQYEDENGIRHAISGDSTISMNFWGFPASFLRAVEEGFPAFLGEALKTDPLKAEYQLPHRIDELIKAGRARVKTLPTDGHWHGVTYKEDKASVANALRAMKDEGLYPRKLW
jgi:NDP-sugar pyrophosphorylase family protein